jgi:protein phosphatase
LPAVLSRIIKDAFEIQASEFVKKINQVSHMLEKEDGQVGSLRVRGRLVEAEPKGEAVVIGDLHGDLDSLTEVLQRSRILERMDKSPQTMLIFLGDYGDRGACSAETYYTVLELKLLNPEQVILMRGNHEGPKDLLPSPHDLPTQFQTRFKEKWAEVYAEVRGLFQHLYNALLVDKRYLMIHGGLPRKPFMADDIASATTLHPQRPLLEEILWSDPDEAVKEFSPSPRGAGTLFGKKVTDRVLAKLRVKILIRGHEPCEDGFKINHGGKVLTLFSLKGPPYFNTYGAYLDVSLARKFENAKELIPYIHRF